MRRILSLALITCLLSLCLPLSGAGAAYPRATRSIDTAMTKGKKPAPTKVTLNHTGTVELTVGEKLQLRAALAPEGAATKLTWSTSDKKVAKVSGKGVVTAVKAGTAKITVTTANKKKASVTIKVKKAIVKPTGISLDRTGLITMAKGETLRLKATVKPEGAQTRLLWISSKPEVATVDQEGNVTAIAAGTTKVKVQTDNKLSAFVNVKVAKATRMPHTSVNYPYDKIDFEDEIWRTLTDTWGISDMHAAAIMGNIEAECTYCPYNAQYHDGLDDRTKYVFQVYDSVAFGLCQWKYHSRKNRLLAYARQKGSEDLVWDFDTQMEFLKLELSLETLTSKATLYLATEWFDIVYLNPGQSGSNSWPGTRYEKAKKAYRAHTGKNYVEKATKFFVTHDGVNVLTADGYVIDKNPAAGQKSTLVVKSNYYWRVEQINPTKPGWLRISCPDNGNESSMCGYYGTTDVTLSIAAAPPAGETYSTTLRFTIYRGSREIRTVPVTLSCS